VAAYALSGAKDGGGFSGGGGLPGGGAFRGGGFPGGGFPGGGFAGGARRTPLADVAWALVNSTEFLYRH